VRRTTRALAATLAIGLAGCPTSSDGAAGSRQKPVVACARAGDNCEVTPGKIGLCTAKSDDCTQGAACLTCMPLH
jgi:hypothetical protein